MGNVATRLISLIMMLQSRPSWKASELAAELSVSERTVHRYIRMLDEMGIPIYSERGPYGGFSLVRGYRLPPLLFTAEEATVLYMGARLVREAWGQTYIDAVAGVAVAVGVQPAARDVEDVLSHRGNQSALDRAVMHPPRPADLL